MAFPIALSFTCLFVYLTLKVCWFSRWNGLFKKDFFFSLCCEAPHNAGLIFKLFFRFYMTYKHRKWKIWEKKSHFCLNSLNEKYHLISILHSISISKIWFDPMVIPVSMRLRSLHFVFKASLLMLQMDNGRINVGL